jgi:hypothetical protein
MTRGRRLAGQLAVLPVLGALSMASDDAFTLAVGIEIVVVWPITVAVAIILTWIVHLAEQPDTEGIVRPAPASLIEAADDMVTVALISSGIAVAGAVAIARIVFEVQFGGRPVLVLLGWALVLVGVPALSRLGTLRHVWLPMLAGRLRRD